MDAPGEQRAQLLVFGDWLDFFLRSAFRSGYFIILVALCAAVILLDLYILAYHWSSLSTLQASVFYVYGLLGAVVPMIRLLRAHGRIHEMYLAGRVSEVVPGSPLSVALETASEALQRGLFYTLTTVLFALFVLLHFGVHTH